MRGHRPEIQSDSVQDAAENLSGSGRHLPDAGREDGGDSKGDQQTAENGTGSSA
jgi:hypothetical protein